MLKNGNTPRPLQDFDVRPGGYTELPLHRILFGTAAAIVLVGQSAVCPVLPFRAMTLEIVASARRAAMC